MAKHSSTKLVSPKTKPKDTVLEALGDAGTNEQEPVPVLYELDNEIECPRCHEIMELYSKFDELLYSCQSCSFLLKSVYS
jgi:hypothetical protein